MSKSKASSKKQGRELASVNILPRFNPAHLALPEEEIRRLALIITTRDSVEPFVRRMVVLLDSLRAGETGEVARISRQSKDEAFVVLMSAMRRAVGEGRVFAARNTAFMAASYAYQNSLDYVCELLAYLNRLR
ncbi:MAG TPA: hypothetical protein VNA19_12530 [Pyrinomonadaceae bacterium]|jgi:hypothetical protein|nr:hypothetical protein [Pyrinomonadaceae bacterium]